jgi:amino acid adenylation domain-containing protein
MFNTTKYQRKLSFSEKTYLAMDDASIPMTVQLIVEFDNDLDSNLLQNAIELASNANPGSRLRLKRKLKGATWVDSGICPKLIEIDAPWNADEADCNPYVDRSLGNKNEPTTEVLMFNNATLLFRAHHAVMDGKGIITWMEDIFSALNGEIPKGSNCNLTDREQALSLGRTAHRPYYASNAESPISNLSLSINNVVGVQKLISGVYPGLVARIIEIITKQLKGFESTESGIIARFMTPVDMRRHRPEVRTTANMSSPLIININQQTNWADIQQSLVEKLENNDDGMVGKWDHLFQYLPSKMMTRLVKQIFHSHEESGQFVFSTTISNFGKIDLNKFSGTTFRAKKVSTVPIADPLGAITIVTLEFEDHIEITISSLSSNNVVKQEQKKLLGLIELGLKEGSLKQVAVDSTMSTEIDSVNSSDKGLNLLLGRTVDFLQKKSIKSPDEQCLSVDFNDYQQLKIMCQKQDVTLSAALHFSWHKLLNAYNREAQTIVGTLANCLATVSGAVRNNFEISPLVVNWVGNKHVNILLSDIDKGISSLAPQHLENSDLFHSILIFDNDLTLQADDKSLEFSHWLNKAKLNYPLCLMVQEQSEGLKLKLNYDDNLLDKHQVTRLLNQMHMILKAISDNPEQPEQAIDLISDKERDLLLNKWNQTEISYPKDKTLHQMFAEQVANNPSKVAVVYKDESLSYQELYNKSQELALYLQSMKVKPESLVGLCMRQSIDMIVGIFGILQAGGAYVPLDPEHPDDRLAFMLEDTQASIVLTEEKLEKRLLGLVSNDAQLVVLDQQWPEITNQVAQLVQNKISLVKEVMSHNLIYVIYTSGSTGKPKGVMVEHSSVINYLSYCDRNYSSPNSAYGSFTHFPLTFDASVTSLFTPLISGKTLEISAKDNIDIFNDGEFLDKGYEFIKLTPSHLQLLNNSFDKIPEDLLTNKNVLILGGEPLTSEHLNFLNGPGVNIDIINEYGPTEATVGCITSRLSISDLYDEKSNDFKNITIGKPIDNTSIYILNHENEPQPIGIPGELHIAGDGLARGYLNQTTLTQEKFIDNPFNLGSRMYKSGDLARWLPDGNIEYLGRIDSQVKIRGYRIELGEVESALVELDMIKQAVVIDLERKGSKFLAAYLVMESGIQIDHERLRKSLSSTLPEYMVPMTFTLIDSIPMTLHGKLDRAALPIPTFDQNDNYAKPRTELEEILCSIWQEVLGVEKIGIHDDFFRVGGDSIKSIKLVYKLRKIGMKLDLKVLFEIPTIAQISHYLEH